MLKIILYSYTQSIFSGRRIENFLKDSIRVSTKSKTLSTLWNIIMYVSWDVISNKNKYTRKK